MGFTSFKGLWSEMSGRGAGLNMVVWSLMSALSVGGAVGCGVEPSLQETAANMETQSRAQREGNGLSLNGLSLNGLSLNGLSLNGLSLNGLSTEDFAKWFNANIEGHSALMSYMVLCAVPLGETRHFENPATGMAYTWVGGLGLAPEWSGGKPATEVEQQLVSACLAAHVNNYKLHVPISVLGEDAQGTPIPYTEEELTTFAQNESCFFGNVFTTLNPGLFAGNDRGSLDPTQSTPRPCGLTGLGGESHPACPQIQRIGQCSDHCVLAPGDKYYAECTYKEKTYKMITTRIRTEDVHTCGDGVCQVGERKGSGYTADSCSLDCGT
ncbi:hypothetical protein [Melittangium boletus]|uniref:Uncharacterized protein n=1 Tax=Melittangium boletus DSM 14713 TaxID=1294270 RepID=A0A250IF59_9BACT|nr:hypothetical protein [Melittangium boletus]ATB30469.1 hypothetical protein MEBOL_003930 [Melittangium boletus DSM 14713]